jgi:menaquinone-9 beta-reductase
LVNSLDRVLRDSLIAPENHEDWDRAAHAYAREHDRHYHVVHTWEDWFTSFFYDSGEQAEAAALEPCHP